MSEKTKIYFMGSGEIAVPILRTLSNSDKIELVGTGTQEDRPAGRKRKLTPTPVGAWCDSEGIHADRIESVNTQSFLVKLRKLSPDIILVVSFGQLLKDEILALPSVGCVNIHASLLPKYRGASPIASAILNGDPETGVAFMKMERGLDTGPVYEIFKYALTGKEKSGPLESALGELAAGKAEEVLTKIKKNALQPTPQNSSKATYSGKIKKKDGVLNWHEPAELIDRKIKAYHPWPGMTFGLKLPAKELRIRVTEAIPASGKGTPGEVLEANKKNWTVACSKGALELLRIVPQGKREMTGPEFLRGCQLQKGSVIISDKNTP